MLIFFKKNKIK